MEICLHILICVILMNKFEFSGYVAQSPLESEHLIVFSRYGKVTVYRDISGDSPEYDDDFEEIKAQICIQLLLMN